MRYTGNSVIHKIVYYMVTTVVAKKKKVKTTTKESKVLESRGGVIF